MVNDFLAGNGSERAAVFSLDPDWVRADRKLLETCEGERYVAVALDTHPDLANIPGVTYLQQRHEPGLSDDPRYVHTGGNSGYAAINLAYLKHAKRIHLVGYDMVGRNGVERDKFRDWAPRFDSMLPQLKAAGITVINHNPDSAITAFETEAA